LVRSYLGDSIGHTVLWLSGTYSAISEDSSAAAQDRCS
jgi:hypothetical protein